LVFLARQAARPQKKKLETDFHGQAVAKEGVEKQSPGSKSVSSFIERIFRREGRDSRTFGPAPDARNPVKFIPPEILKKFRRPVPS
jgi:hypothetical protein